MTGCGALRLLAGALAALTIAACQSVTSPVVQSTGVTATTQAARPNDSNCGVSDSGMSHKGGTVGIPSIPSSGNYYGAFQYAALSKKLNPGEQFVACMYDFDNIPIPAGYLYDWFGSWRIYADTGSFSFESGTLIGSMYSSVWVKKRSYFLYLYTLDGQLILSQPMGPVNKKGYLRFASPFENGLVFPGSFEFEIVHPAKKDA